MGEKKVSKAIKYSMSFDLKVPNGEWQKKEVELSPIAVLHLRTLKCHFRQHNFIASVIRRKTGVLNENPYFDVRNLTVKKCN